MDGSLVFTFFDMRGSSKSAQVYCGQFNDRSQLQDLTVAYGVKIEGRNICATSSPSGEVLLSGRLVGVTKSHSTLHGYQGSAIVQKDGLFGSSWKIIDFAGNAYKWDVEYREGAWKLLDVDNKVIAEFDRSAWKQDIKKRLNIRPDVPESRLALIILTNKLVHNRVSSVVKSSVNWGS
ncbi:hypothetical protein NQZ79_g1730 [Umbelopsis isabellina]|nr:hypothetical protein NQZ79_g1730 [Umbelopsis isabellina]